MIKINRHPFKFYFSLSILFSIFTFVSIILIYATITEFRRNEFNIKTILGAISISSLTIYTIISFFRNTPTVKIKDNKITFKYLFNKNETYNLNDIKKISFTGKKPFKLLFFENPTEGMKIEFNDKIKKYLFDDLYSNLSELKIFLKSKNQNQRKQVNNTNKFNLKIIKGNGLISFYGILSIVLILFTLFLITKISYPIKIGYVISISLFSFMTYAFSNLLNFFVFSNGKLIIKNHLLFWRKVEIDTSKIKEVSREQTSSRTPDGLRVITSDFKSIMYMTGTYGEDEWNELIIFFKSINIKINKY